MEKLFQFTSKWSNIDSGLKAQPGGLQTQEASLCLSHSQKYTSSGDLSVSAHSLIDFLYIIATSSIIKPSQRSALLQFILQ